MPDNDLQAGEGKRPAAETEAIELIETTETTETETASYRGGFGYCAGGRRVKPRECGEARCHGTHHGRHNSGRHGNGRCCER